MPRRRREEPAPLSIAGRLEHLIATTAREGRSRLDSQQIAALTQTAGHPLTSSYISQLRRGSRTNPTIDSLRVLAAIFGVPVSYFFPVHTQSDDPAQTPAEASTDRVGSATGGPQVETSVSAKLEELFSRPQDPAGRPQSTGEVAERCQKLGYDLDAAYLDDLRTGRRDNPSIKALEGIAAAFGEHTSFFFSARPGVQSERDDADADRALTAAMKDQGVRDIALRSAALDPAGRRLLAAMIRELGDVTITRHDPTPPPGQDAT